MTNTHNIPADDELTEIARMLDARIGEMLPGIRASDERNIRSSNAAHQRRMGEPLSIEEIRHDLHVILARFVAVIILAKDKQVSFLATPAQILMYAERASTYAMQDYSRNFEGNADVMGLWNALEKIHNVAHEWRIGKYSEHEQAAIALIEFISQDAIGGLYPDEKGKES